MKVIIIGGVAGGASCAARLRRLDEAAQIIMVERTGFVSYANCGLPYYVGGAIQDKKALTLQTPQSFQSRFRVDARVKQEVIAIDRAVKTVTIRRLDDGSTYTESYDKLVLTPGAKAVKPPLPGIDSNKVHTLRTVEDALALRKLVEDGQAKTAVVIGGGFIGLEAAENLTEAGAKVTLVEKLPQVMAPLDADMAGLVAAELRDKGVTLRLGTGVSGFEDAAEGLNVSLDSGDSLPCDLAVLAIGVAPDTLLAKEAGLELGLRGALKVDEHLRTSDPDIYAAGDAVQLREKVTGQDALISLAGPANKQGRIVAANLCGKETKYLGAQASSVLKVFSLTAACTGINERTATAQGLDFETVVLPAAASHATYYPGATNMVLKVLFERKTGKVLGAQAVGQDGVEKRIDVLATSLHAGLTSADLCELDLSYAPPYSSAKDPVNQAGYIMENVRDGLVKQAHWRDLDAIRANANAQLLDVRTDAEFARGHVDGAQHIPLDALRERLGELDKHKTLYVNCQSALRSYLACRILSQNGFDCFNMVGGWRWYTLTHPAQTAPAEKAVVAPCGIKAETVSAPAGSVTVSAADIKRVKALGFLHCKGTDDFNVRVITRNGKVTGDEMQAITSAAKKFGNGEVAMTTRLTMEIQHVPYGNEQIIIEDLGKAGLLTGGTGSKVRPVVSCKGTTCQYGLIDTFALSDKLHELFYLGYHDVSLPHKFKLAVGGCPNNCVKPDLNDLGIIGQRLPVLDADKCRGCGKCQIEAACPIHSARVVDGKLDFGERCNHCGRCVEKCPFGAVHAGVTGYKVVIGGRWGKQVAQGRALEKVFTTEAEVLSVVEKAILLFREQGISGERFSDTVARLGFENVQAQLLTDDLLARKAQILGKNVIGGATC